MKYEIYGALLSGYNSSNGPGGGSASESAMAYCVQYRETDWNFVARLMEQEGSSTPYRPSRLTSMPTVSGTQTAVVVGQSGEEIYTDKYGRVKVQFHWDRYGRHDENSSCWIRVSQSLAGSSWGRLVLPRIGNELIIPFMQGNPDRPIITGRVYNSDRLPPYSSGGDNYPSMEEVVFPYRKIKWNWTPDSLKKKDRWGKRK